MSVQENKAVVKRYFDEVWNEGKLATIDELYALGFVGHDPFARREVQGTEGRKQYVAMFRAAFPDLHFTVEAQIGEEDLVVTRWSVRGTFTGPFMGIKPTGKPGVVTGVTIDRFAEGKFVESWIHRDDLGMLQNMGVVPELAAAPV